MHVRLLAGYLNRGSGSAVYNWRLANELFARRHQVSVIAFAPSDLLDPAIPVTSLAPAEHHLRPWWRFEYPLNVIGMTWRLRKLPLTAPDIAIAAEHFMVLGHARRFRGVPWVYLPHSRVLAEDVALRYEGLRRQVAVGAATRLQAWALRNATTTLRFHDESRQALIDAFGLRAGHPFFVNPPGIVLPSTTPDRSMRAEYRFLTVGALSRRKNVALAIRALAGVRDDARWRYDIVGEGEERPALERLAAEAGLGGRVHFHGAQPDVDHFYEGADVFLFPSIADNAPLVVMEAMSWGLPVVALDDHCPGTTLCNRTAVDNGRTGLLCRSDADFAAAVRRMLEQAGLARMLGHVARAEAVRRFSWASHVDRLEAMLEETATRRAWRP
jgi:glycosyltransferase involved in cell wall biosynthesis